MLQQNTVHTPSGIDNCSAQNPYITTMSSMINFTSHASTGTNDHSSMSMRSGEAIVTTTASVTTTSSEADEEHLILELQEAMINTASSDGPAISPWGGGGETTGFDVTIATPVSSTKEPVQLVEVAEMQQQQHGERDHLLNETYNDNDEPSSQPNGRSDVNVFITHLPLSVDDQQLARLCQPFGDIESSVIMRDIFTGSSRGVGFVLFKNAPDAQRCIQTLHRSRVGGKTISVQPAKKFDRGSLSSRVFIRNVPKLIHESALRDLCAKFGQVSWVSVHTDTQQQHQPNQHRHSAVTGTRAERNIAFVNFGSVQQASYAAKCLHNTLPFPQCEGVPLLTKVVVDDGSLSSKEQHQQQQQQQQQQQKHASQVPATATTSPQSIIHCNNSSVGGHHTRNGSGGSGSVSGWDDTTGPRTSFGLSVSSSTEDAVGSATIVNINSNRQLPTTALVTQQEFSTMSSSMHGSGAGCGGFTYQQQVPSAHMQWEGAPPPPPPPSCMSLPTNILHHHAYAVPPHQQDHSHPSYSLVDPTTGNNTPTAAYSFYPGATMNMMQQSLYPPPLYYTPPTAATEAPMMMMVINSNAVPQHQQQQQQYVPFHNYPTAVNAATAQPFCFATSPPAHPILHSPVTSMPPMLYGNYHHGAVTLPPHSPMSFVIQ